MKAILASLVVCALASLSTAYAQNGPPFPKGALGITLNPSDVGGSRAERHSRHAGRQCQNSARRSNPGRE